ncbi:hypothetical protein C8F04DRAFT_1193408 [Mycena alexandri]|uniref:Uncharacterized protein n=1 Tax=Mycena alexandri TaxID=1745969 RepID=A0AAD6SA72_9AGAR|nr:hypothetical protein C8F04DRAFT_1193408 [Mycena alexandri]
MPIWSVKRAESSQHRRRTGGEATVESDWDSKPKLQVVGKALAGEPSTRFTHGLMGSASELQPRNSRKPQRAGRKQDTPPRWNDVHVVSAWTRGGETVEGKKTKRSGEYGQRRKERIQCTPTQRSPPLSHAHGSSPPA